MRNDIKSKVRSTSVSTTATHQPLRAHLYVNAMYLQLSLGVTNKHHVHSVAAAIVMYDMKVKSQHYARIAFLVRISVSNHCGSCCRLMLFMNSPLRMNFVVATKRHCYNTWDALPSHTYKTTDKGKRAKISRISFWRFVDSELQRIRRASAEEAKRGEIDTQEAQTS